VRSCVCAAGLIFAGIQLAGNIYFYVIRGHEPPYKVDNPPASPLAAISDGTDETPSATKPTTSTAAGLGASASSAGEEAVGSSGGGGDVLLKEMSLPFGSDAMASGEEGATEAPQGRKRAKSIAAVIKLQVGPPADGRRGGRRVEEG
jgi:hypothetical protein